MLIHQDHPSRIRAPIGTRYHCRDDNAGTVFRVPMRRERADPEPKESHVRLFRNPGGAISVRWRPLALALVAGFALFGGGCGGDPSGAPAPASPATPATTPTDPAPPVWTRPTVTHRAPLFPENSSGSGKEGFVRIANHSFEDGTVRIVAFAEDGRDFGPVTVATLAGQTIHLTSDDLARGNPAMGVSGALGSGWGNGRLELTSELEIMVLSYIRHQDGFLTAMHDAVPREGNAYWVPTFNPSSESNQASRLRLINAGKDHATVRIRGFDDRGVSSSQVTVSVPAGATREFTAAELESGSSTTGALGAGAGKWRLVLESEDDLSVANLMESPAGHVANLSTAPSPGRNGEFAVPLFPGASDPRGRRGLLRIINHSARDGEVRIAAYDDNGRRHPPFSRPIGAGQAIHLDSDDLEAELSTGGSAGSRRLLASSGLDIEVLSYIEHPDGFLTAMHDVAPLGGHRVATFPPGGRLRLVNAGAVAAQVTVAAVDDRGSSSARAFEVSVPAAAAREFAAAEMGFGGSSGNRRLVIDSEGWVAAMSLLESPAGHLANLSTEPRQDPVPVVEPPVLATLGNPAGVAVSLVDAEGFDPGTHGQVVTDTFLAHTQLASLRQIGDTGRYALNGSVLRTRNQGGYAAHSLTHGGGIFWTASNNVPGYRPNVPEEWVLEARPAVQKGGAGVRQLEAGPGRPLHRRRGQSALRRDTGKLRPPQLRRRLRTRCGGGGLDSAVRRTLGLPGAFGRRDRDRRLCRRRQGHLRLRGHSGRRRLRAAHNLRRVPGRQHLERDGGVGGLCHESLVR